MKNVDRSLRVLHQFRFEEPNSKISEPLHFLAVSMSVICQVLLLKSITGVAGSIVVSRLLCEMESKVNIEL